ncbi:glycosyl transferase [Microvirga sp. KLBC 81]|uniref:MraY family glycosyltransferase n=1 Tax=Microvirga sp. KLBC 81 TaxID=1862707 RepID=UPI000D51E78C|nr:glycosyltransferase family 4 protein [Microvirga sp. KLBC 81]PVE24809.1 glycosyl transferase [Microvirga sp. KLBC 81]
MASLQNFTLGLLGPLERQTVLSGLLIVSALLSAALIVLLMPLLQRYALARPNARSSHRIPTPQGGGIAVLAATVIPIAVLIFVTAPDIKLNWGSGNGFRFISIVLLAAIGLAVVGAVDDIRPLHPIPRLLLQVVAVAAAVTVFDITGPRILPSWIPEWFEIAFLVLGGVWFVNLVNFMDGLDWITVAEMVPITAFLAGLGIVTSMPAAFMAAALCGALLGFAVFNKPVARLFLGDVGSLPIGLMVGWLLLMLARNGTFAAAILLPLYYLMDATITLFRRLAKRERVWEAHRSHFYQRATDNGFSVMAVVTHVFMLNLALALLAAMTLVWPSSVVQVAALAAGILLVSLVLWRFSHPRVTASVEVPR